MAFNKIVSRYSRWRRYRATVRELESLSSHELADIGLTRDDIPRQARGANL